MVSNYIIAKLHLSEDVSLMAMIDNDTIHFFDNSGNISINTSKIENLQSQIDQIRQMLGG
jgi:hypothetical protein